MIKKFKRNIIKKCVGKRWSMRIDSSKKIENLIKISKKNFVGKDWEKILTEEGFNHFEEYVFFKKYVRLLKGKKIS